MRIIGYRQQRTLAGMAEIRGTGFITGASVVLRLHPAVANTGIIFTRIDLPTRPHIPARVAMVTGTDRRTTLGLGSEGITLIEHLMSALAGLRVDNCLIELDGQEPPGLDGSAAGFVHAIGQAGIVSLNATHPIRAVKESVVISANGATLSFHPTNDLDLRVSYMLDYGAYSPIHPQAFTLVARPENFVREVASCRTFLTEAEALQLRSQGIGAHLTAAEVLVYGRHGLIGNRPRFADEPARHKVLDLIGDLALCGFDLAGHVVGYRSGHSLNVELARALDSMASEDHEHGDWKSGRTQPREAAA